MTSRTTTWRGLLVSLGLVAAQAVVADPADFPIIGIATGVNVTSGSYGGTADIEDVEVPLVLSIDYPRWAVTARIPYLSVRTTDGNQTSSESGLGDISASITVFDVLSDWERGLALDVTGAVKFGTAEPEQALGTGENDATLYVDGYKFFDRLTLLGSVGHRWRGSTPDVPLNDVFLATVGASFRTGDALIGMTFDYRESSLEDVSDIQELRAFASLSLGDNWVLECHAFTGFSDSSADWGGGIAVATQLRRFGSRVADY